MRLRIKFTKHGDIRFIGHLDVMRYFQKTLRRAGVDVAYTTGYSPHQIMSFASPLGVGLESNGEYMDIEVYSLIDCADVQARINAASIPDIQVTDVRILPEKAGNAMASVAAAAYTVRFVPGREPAADLTAALPAYLAQDTILIEKAGKSGVRQVNIRPGIYACTCTDGVINLLVDASSAGNIKPMQVIETLVAFCGAQLQENALRITREETYADIGTDSRRKLVPLNEVEIAK
ncbi:MAG: TIGR03936 family radical SAM-associated protein [Lachnospiraceae bacterium]|nr:TIGR03936 family radical SAM-associated protein [Lachnospiraceae bacterium]